MLTFARSGMAVLSLCLAHAAVAVETSGAGQKDAATRGAVDALLGRLDGLNQDREMTTAKKAFIAAEAVEKFNQQCKGKPLTVRLKVQDVVPNSAGYCITAHEPDLTGVQYYTGRFQDALSSSDVLSVKKEETVLAVTGLVSASNQAKLSGRLSTTVKPGGNVSFPLRAGLGCQVLLENVSFKLETASAVQPAASTSRFDGHSSTLTGGDTSADRLKSERMRGVDDVKLFFMKGILVPPLQTTASGAGTRIGTGTSPSTNSRYNSGNTSNTGIVSPPPKYKHNRIYTAAEIMQKFGTPSARSSKGTSEEWVFKCKDGIVHVHFTQSGFVRSVSSSKPDSLKLEIKSIDSTAATRSY